jgi:cytochrome c
MIRRQFCQVFLAASFAAICSSPAVAQERGNFDDAKAMMSKALAHIKKVGTDTAFKDFTNDKANWNYKDIYIFALDMKGNQLAHGANAKQVGKNFWEFKDANGKLLFQEFAAAAAKGGGDVEYQWAHPVTKKVETKISHIEKVAGTDFYIGAGAYK